MNHLYLFLRRVLIVFLVSTLTFVSTFTGAAIADESDSSIKIDINVNGVPQVDINVNGVPGTTAQFKSKQQIDTANAGEENIVRPFVNVCTLRRTSETNSSVTQPTFKNPPFADADDGHVVTLRATKAPFTLEGNGKQTGEDPITYQGYVYGATAMIRQPGIPTTINKKTLLPSYTPPVIEVSPSKEDGVDNILNVKLINDLPVNVQLAGNLPQTKENLESVSQYTNLHYHGFNVSPLLGGDDVLVDVPSNVTPKPVDIPSHHKDEIELDGTADNDDVYVTYDVYSDNEYKLIPVPPLGQTTPPVTGNPVSNPSEDQLPGGYYPTDDPTHPKYGGPISEYNMNFLIPDVHQSGLFWYHSHAHSMSDNQVRGGLSGGIIIKGNEEYYGQFAKPEPPKSNIQLSRDSESEETEFEANSLTGNQVGKEKIAQQVMLFKDFNDVLGTKKENCFVLNSQVNPKITMAPGEIQLWRVANIGADQYMNIALESIKEPDWSHELKTTSLKIDDTDITVGNEIGTMNGTVSLGTIKLSASNKGSLEDINAIDVTVVDNSEITDVNITSAELSQIKIDTNGNITGKIKKGDITATVNGQANQSGTITNKPNFTGTIKNIDDVKNATPEFTEPWEQSNFYILARDGDVVEKPVATNSILLPPAARAEFLVVGPKEEGTYYLVSDLDTDLTKNEQPFANQLQSHLLATVEVEGDDVVEYTYKPKLLSLIEPPAFCKVSASAQDREDCTGYQEINLDYFITHQKPSKIDEVLPEPSYVADLDDECKSKITLNKLTTKQRKKLLPLVNGDQNKLESLTSKSCITGPDTYDDPLTKKRYFYFSSESGKFFLKGFETEVEAKAEKDGSIDKDKIKELFDGNRIDKISQVGDIEEWHLVNTDNFAHVFHIHQLDFLVTEVTLPEDPGSTYNNYEVNGDCTGATLPDGESGFRCNLKTQGYRDVINLPANSTTTVRIPFVNPFITGVFVYHCHILGHEDAGMMNNIKVINPKGFNELDMKQLKSVIESFRD